ncbi:putative methyltransferase-domain-containing protein [Suillus clintonianus]|uniref:putative methyltransferase-domain-containing protein n=1 Tax=Suillus clintonianus TaxID=1904413 RepID=UPI001B86B25C|nr:putative methyltransferase-domain-containing protein [Suillus clintonianus]KAG2148071.1 putative methyltransferase-domain-containing protein [Suillus clintonianus]
MIEPTSLLFDNPPELVAPNLNEIALDEALDMLDPLRHLRTDASDFARDHEDIQAAVVPSQPRSILGETIQLSFPVGSPLVSISLKVDASHGCGGIAWPAGEVLSNYIAFRGNGYLDGKKIVELGSGTGLVGLVAGALGGTVWITDQAPMLDIMQQNVTLNNLQSCVSVRELNWGETLLSDMPPPELILAADCVYFEPAFPLLVQTLSEMAVSGSTEILFCYKKRRKADKRFFTMLKKKFAWEEVMDDPNREIYNREAISLLTLSKRP